MLGGLNLESDKLLIWFKPTGWRPAGFEEKYPVAKITDPYHFNKYKTEFSLNARVWIWFQFFITLGFLTVMFYYFGKFSLNQMLIYGLFVFLNIYAYTELMDKNPDFLLFELGKNLFGFVVILFTEFWSPLFEVQPIFKTAFLAYLILSSVISIYMFRTKEVLSKSFA